MRFIVSFCLLYLTVVIHPAYAATKTFKIITTHSNISFKIQHLVTKVKGEFTNFKGKIELDQEDLTQSKVTAIISVESISTNNKQRDEHLLSGDFFDVKVYPEIIFVSKKITKDKVIGDLTMHGVTKEVSLDYEFHGVRKDKWHNLRAGFSVQGVLDRQDFNIVFNQQLDTGGFVLGNEITIEIDLEVARSQKLEQGES